MKITAEARIGFLLLLFNVSGLAALAAVWSVARHGQAGDHRILLILCGAGALNFALLLAGLWISRVYIVRPWMQQKRHDDRTHQARKMEAIGSLCGTVAHDFNNILTIISGYAQLIAERHLDADSRTGIGAVEQAAQRAAALTRQLMAFSRKPSLQPRIVDLNRLVTDACSTARTMIGTGIEIDTELAADLSPASLDPIQIQQVVLNLASNARDAMPSGGHLTIKTENIRLREQSDVDLPGGHYVRLMVRDTGCGMDEATKTRIFEPFFTTKARERSTGLGLSTVYAIVQQSGGAISVESRPGKGTRFDIYFLRDPSPQLRKSEVRAVGIAADSGWRAS